METNSRTNGTVDIGSGGNREAAQIELVGATGSARVNLADALADLRQIQLFIGTDADLAAYHARVELVRQSLRSLDENFRRIVTALARLSGD